MKKHCKFIFLLFIISGFMELYSQNTTQLIMPPYPGALAAGISSRQISSQFLTRDSLQQVQAFYARQPGAPSPRIRDNTILFQLFDDSDDKIGLPADILGVHIVYADECSHSLSIIRNLESLARERDLEMSDVDVLKKRFSRLGAFSPASEHSEHGQRLDKGSALYRSYQQEYQCLMQNLQKARETRQQAIDASQARQSEEAGQMAQDALQMAERLMQGQFMDAAAMTEDLSRQAENIRPRDRETPRPQHSENRAFRESQEAVKAVVSEIRDTAERYLTEIAAHRYPVLISIRHLP